MSLNRSNYTHRTAKFCSNVTALQLNKRVLITKAHFCWNNLYDLVSYVWTPRSYQLLSLSHHTKVISDYRELAGVVCNSMWQLRNTAETKKRLQNVQLGCEVTCPWHYTRMGSNYVHSDSCLKRGQLLNCRIALVGLITSWRFLIFLKRYQIAGDAQGWRNRGAALA